MMQKYIGIVDHGGANIASVAYALQRLGVSYGICTHPKQLDDCSHLILPGVSSAAHSMAQLQRYDLVQSLKEFDRPILGICMGMQLLFDQSEEGGDVRMLGLIEGNITKFKQTDPKMRIPHMGWNAVQIVQDCVLFKNIPDASFFYYVHSYHCKGHHTQAVGVTEYGGNIFTAMIQQDNLYGCQFHPEKSGQYGAMLIQNFTELSL
jgi:glutamine amidotransferase